MSHLPHREQRPTHRLLPDGDAGMRTRTIDLTLSILASTAALLLSWPYWRDFEYWPESRLAWILYFIVGFALAAYVFHVFIVFLRPLSATDAFEPAEAAQAAAGAAARDDDAEHEP